MSDIRQAASRLVADGIGPGDRVALMSKTRYEWTILDYAVWWVGAVSVPLYPNSSAEYVSWVISDAECSTFFVESAANSAFAEQIVQSLDRPISIRLLNEITNIPSASEPTISDTELEDRRSAVTGADLATIIYTSGTTGSPKGCMLTHDNFKAELDGALQQLSDLFDREEATTLLFLPLAHVFARVVQVGAIRTGVVLGHCRDIADLSIDLEEFQPTFILAVPRVLEKIFNAMSAAAYARGKGTQFDRSTRTAIAYSKAKDRGRVPVGLRARHAAYDKTIYEKVRQALGSKAEYVISGGAPLGNRLGHYFRGIGVTVLEGYGLTESTAALTVNSPGDQRVGTVGKPLPNTEVQLAAGGELMFRGPQIFSGYWNAEPESQQVLSDDGWLATGDIGDIDEDGFIRILGRAQEVLVTAGGKNVSPALLEEQVRSHPWISQCLVVGDQKPFVVALVTLDKSTCELDADHPDVLEAVQTAVDEANSQVSKAEAIRRFVVVDKEWSEENGYLTPSFKLRRQAIITDWHNVIESLYIK